MRNTMKVIAAVVVLAALFAFGCTPTPVTLEVSPPDVIINSPDETPTFTARVLDLQDKPIEGLPIVWSSGDETVATIDAATGKLTPKASGRVEIKGETGACYGIAMVTVSLYKEITVDPKSLKLFEGQVQKIDATIVDEQGTPISGEIIWETSDPKVASVVGSRGEIRGVGPGTTTVFATSKKLRTDVTVEVQKSGPAELGVSTALLKLKMGKTGKVEGKPLDENAQPDKSYTVAYESYDSSVATVDESGVVTPVGLGETKIGVTAGDKAVEVKVRVE